MILPKFKSQIILILTMAIAITINAQDNTGTKQLSLDDIWNSSKFKPNFPNSFRGLSDGTTYCLSERKGTFNSIVSKYDIATGKLISELFQTEQIKIGEIPIIMQDFVLNHNETKAIIKHNIKQIYRHSSTCNALVYDLKSKKETPLPNDIMYPTFSPDGNWVAFVKDNNLYIQSSTSNQTKQITKDGAHNSIINGAVDWVYEEEFGMDVGFYWSPNSEYLAYYRMDESKVPEFSMDIFGTLYPQKETWKYPKAGEVNSVVDAYIYSIKKKKSKKCNTQSQNDQYLPLLKWDYTGSYLSIQRLNRRQNQLEILKADPNSGNTEVIYFENNQYYIEVEDWQCTPEGNWLHLSEKSKYKQLWMYNPNTKQDIQITEGKFDIDQFYGFDAKTNSAYFNAGKEKATERQLFSINTQTKTLKQLSEGAGWHSATFIAGMQFYLDYFSTATDPGAHTLYNANGEKLRVIADNERLKAELAEYALGSQTFASFKNRNGWDIDYWMLLPRDFDAMKRYPVLFYVYGGPGYQTAKNSYGGSNYLWHEYMAQKGYIVITLNNTGSSGKGEEFKKKTYMQLGSHETKDYIDATQYFSQMKFIANDRMGIWGWSYGGFMSSNCITKGADNFKTAVAVAPVTNWRYYDNIYTERYMRTPQENPLGYDTNSPINNISKIKGNYLIIHGTADDNVHFQNAAEMVMALNKENIAYESAYYPNKNHGISGGKTRLHLFTRITNFILENL